jgi:hypothetical protein
LIVPVSAEGFRLYSLLGGHAVVDYLGYFSGESAESSSTGLFVPQSPDRVIDTRLSGGPIAEDSSIDVDTRLPGSGVIVNITKVDSAGPSFMTVWPTGQSLPLASAVNATDASQYAIANLAIVGQSDSKISIYTLREAHAIVDVAGYFFE